MRFAYTADGSVGLWYRGNPFLPWEFICALSRVEARTLFEV